MSRLGRLGELAAWAISGLAWALSYAAQVRLAEAHGFGGPWDWEALAWPLTTDLAGLVGMLLALDQGRRGRPARVAWAIAAASAAVMVAGNVGAAVGDPVAMLLHAWPPSIALASWYLLVHVRRAPSAARERVFDQVHQDLVEDQADGPPALRRRLTSQEAVAARRRLARWVQQDPDLGPAEVARRLNISANTAKRWLMEARRLRVVAETES